MDNIIKMLTPEQIKQLDPNTLVILNSTMKQKEDNEFEELKNEVLNLINKSIDNQFISLRKRYDCIRIKNDNKLLYDKIIKKQKDIYITFKYQFEYKRGVCKLYEPELLDNNIVDKLPNLNYFILKNPLYNCSDYANYIDRGTEVESIYNPFEETNKVHFICPLKLARYQEYLVFSSQKNNNITY